MAANTSPSEEESNSEPPAMLSELLEAGNGYVLPADVDVSCGYAAELQTSEVELTEFENAWLRDFNQFIGPVIRAERELDEKVRESRLKRNNRDKPKINVYDTIKDGHISTLARPETSGTTSLQTGAGGLKLDQNLPTPKQIGPIITANNKLVLPTNSMEIPIMKINELVINPDKFEGKRELARRWLEDFEAAGLANGWSHIAMVRYFATFLKGGARDWYTTVIVPKFGSVVDWSTLRKAFLRYYLGPEEEEAAKDELRRARQRYQESVTEFIPRMMRLLLAADSKLTEKEQTREIKVRLLPAYLDRMVGQRPSSIVELNDLCLDIESRLEYNKKRYEGRKNDGSKEAQQAYAQRGVKPFYKKTPERSGNNPATTSREFLKCTFCHMTGHTEDRCWSKNGRPKGLSKSKVAAIEAVGDELHEDSVPMSTSMATQPEAKQPPRVNTIRNIVSVVAAVDRQEGVFHDIKLEGTCFSAMLDSGSTVSIIRTDVAKALNLMIKSPAGSGLVCADNHQLNCHGTVMVKMELRIRDVLKQVETEFMVVDNLCVPVLLGLELLGWLKIQVRLSDRAVSFEDQHVGMNGVRLTKQIELPGKSESVVEAVARQAKCRMIMTNPVIIGTQLLGANSVSEVGPYGEVRCLIANLDDGPVLIPAGTQIANFEELHEEIDNESCAYSHLAVCAIMKLSASGETTNIGSDLTEAQIVDLEKLISANLDVFSIEDQIGETGLIEHDIVLLENTEPVVEPLRRRPLAHKVETSKQVEKMLKAGIIERSESPWASAYVLVKKKTGDMRLCIDFRKLNEKTKKTSYPLPNTEDCLEPLNGNRFFSQLDLASGYWQIKMSKRAKELTAFRTEDGLFHFRRMPFGLCNAPASFQRLVNALFAGLRGIHLQVFIDDICIATKTWSDHLTLLNEVFGLLRKANLRLKSSKCTFGSKKVIFLGHELSREGIRQDPNRLKALAELPAPKDLDALRRVMGMMNYYRRFVFNYASIVEPLTKLTRKDAIWEWSNEQSNAFAQLKRELCKNIALSTFNHHDPIALKTDASRKGIAGILLQRQGNAEADDWRIITCCSRQLSNAETNYGISDLEGLAIVYSVSKLRNYLLGQFFTIVTDHCALCALKLKMPQSPRLRRWAILLSEFEFTIVYTKGGLHRDVDCLSRAPVDDAVDPYLDDKVMSILNRPFNISCENKVCAIPTAKNPKEWRRLSEADDEAKPHYVKARERTKGYNIFNGLLYFENRLFVPKELREEVLAEGHGEDPACHGGFRATVERLSSYWWPKMADDIRAFVRSCPLCQARKAERALPTGQMHSFDSYEPLALVAFDALGPLPTSLNNRKHVIVAIDCFTRFIDVKAVSDIRGVTFARYLSKFIGRFGVPASILTDNATTFCNADIKNLADKFRFEHRHSTPHHHEGNAMVERVIETLQEKISLITHDPGATVDWETMLPSAVLSINTTVHSSTGYSPFELMFGRRHPLRSELIQEDRSPQDIFFELRELRANNMISDAIHNQEEARAASLPHFERAHRNRMFNVGDLVLARVMGRRAKLQNRFVGPYRVSERKGGDIYKVESVAGRKESLDRHCRDLKPYVIREEQIERHSEPERPNDNDNNRSYHSPNTTNQSSPVNQHQINNAQSTQPANNPLFQNTSHHTVLYTSKKEPMRFKIWFTLFLVVNPAACIVFEEVPPVVWQPTRTYVSTGPTRVNLEVRFINPCQVINQFQVQPMYAQEVQSAIKQCNAVFNEQILLKIHQIQQAQLNVPSVIVPFPNGPKPSPGWAPQSSQQQHLQQMTNRVSSRRKRELISFLCGAVACNVIETVVDKLWNGNTEEEIKEREHALEHTLQDLNAHLNFTMVEVLAQAKALDLQRQLVEHAIHRIDTLISTFPQLAVVTASMVARMHILGAYIDKLRTSFRAKRPDLETMALLFNIDKILDVDPNSIEGRSVQITAPARHALRVTFTGRIQATNMTIYRVKAAKHWVNLFSAEPELMEYRGPPAVLRNSAKSCVTGIKEPQTSYVTGQCHVANFTDPKLANSWETIKKGDPRSFKLAEPEILEAYPFVYIYCYPGNFTYRQTTTACPPYTFKLDYMETWTTTNYVYTVSTLDNVLDTTLAPPLMEVQKAHFPNGSFTLDKSAAVTEIRDLQTHIKQMEQEVIVMRNTKYIITYKHTSWSMLIILGAVIAWWSFSKWCRKPPIKEKVKQTERGRSHSVPSQYRSRMPRVTYAPVRTFPIRGLPATYEMVAINAQ